MSVPPKKKCKFLATRQGCCYGSRCRFSHASVAPEQPAHRSRRRRSQRAPTAAADPLASQPLANTLLQIPGYTYDPNSKKYFKSDPSFKPTIVAARLPSTQANQTRHMSIPPLLAALRCYRTVPPLQRHPRFALRLQYARHLRDTTVETYPTRVSRLQPFPNGDVGVLAAGTYRHTSMDDSGEYTAAVQMMMSLDARSVLANASACVHAWKAFCRLFSFCLRADMRLALSP